MAKQVSKTVIGAFVISAIALIVIGVVVFGSGRFFQKTNKYVLFFDGSVKGLEEGSPVVWRGVKVGSVSEVSIHADPDTMAMEIPVIIEIDPERFQVKGEAGRKRDPKQNVEKLIGLGLRAKLATQSFVTGQLMIDLDLRPESPARFVGSDLPYPEIPTVPSTLEQIAQTINELPIKQMFNKLEDAIDNVSETLGDPALKGILASAKEAVDNAKRLIQHTDKLLVNFDRQVVPLANSITTAAEDAQQLIRNVDSHVEPLTVKVEEAFDAAEVALVQAKETLQGIENFTAEDSSLHYRLTKALDELAMTARSLRALSDYLEQHPDAVLRGKDGPGGES
jgi:paraquat-inducible protein B